MPCFVGEEGLVLVTYHGDFRVVIKSGVTTPYPFSPAQPDRYVDARDLDTLERWRTVEGKPMFAWSDGP